MYKSLGGIFVLLIIPFFLWSQILPKEGRVLNYRIIGFSFPAVKDIKSYRLEIASGSYNTADSFVMNIIDSQDSKSNKIIFEVPYFGKGYTWRVVTINNGKGDAISALHHFNTGIDPNGDSDNYRVRIIKNTGAYKDACFFLDGTQSLYDMEGKAVWFLPRKDELKNAAGDEIRDLRLSPQGTITFLNSAIFEVNFNGDILWQDPEEGKESKGKKPGRYHHGFTRLENGNYMAMGYELVYWNAGKNKLEFLPVSDDHEETDTNYKRVKMGCLVELDKDHNIVWKWSSAKYFNGSDLFKNIPFDSPHQYIAHDNAFYFDDENKNIYISFKSLNRITKIKYPDGTVLQEYNGVKETNRMGAMADMFCSQHCCKVSKEGYLYLFNNNDCHKNAFPTIVMLRQPVSAHEKVEKVWEYECVPGPEDDSKIKDTLFTTGGSVQQLPGGEIFTCMSEEYSKVFIVGHDKNITWSAMPEKWNNEKRSWERAPSYKAYMVTNHNKIEQQIWKAEASQ